MSQNGRWDGEPLMEDAAIREVQSVLAAFPGLGSATVVEHYEEPVGHCLVAYVSPGGIDVTALQSHARNQLPGHLMPATIVVLDEIPVTADGTTDQRALPAPDLGGLKPYRTPGTARQKAICEIFADVLRVPRFGVDDDFFSLGGQSVDAVVLAERISATFGVVMRMTDVFDAPTVAELDRRLSMSIRANATPQ
jgi:acyl carrier protein